MWKFLVLRAPLLWNSGGTLFGEQVRIMRPYGVRLPFQTFGSQSCYVVPECTGLTTQDPSQHIGIAAEPERIVVLVHS